MTHINVYPISLGCPKNRVDTEHALGALGQKLKIVSHLGHAHMVFINTCGFIGPAVQESVRTILECISHMNRLKRQPYLAVAGCLVGRYGENELKKELPEVDLWLSNDKLAHWPVHMAKLLNFNENNLSLGARLMQKNSASAWLKISDGCRHSCSFCTIPSIRGKHRSTAAENLVHEAQGLLNNGVKELVLVAQDVSAWGEDFGQKNGLCKLLEQLLPLKGLEWLRLMYLYPAGITTNLLELMQDNQEKLLPYFDIPLQHAHPQILQSMGRPFARDPRHTIDLVRKYIPHAAIRTSFIVGFPSEQDEHFNFLRDFIIETRFQHLGIFSYAAEDGTRAALMPDQVEEDVKILRKNELMQIQAEISSEILEQYVGKSLPILVDNVHDEWPGLHVGRAWFQAPEVDGITYISGEGVHPANFVNADIVESANYDLTALA